MQELKNYIDECVNELKRLRRNVNQSNYKKIEIFLHKTKAIDLVRQIGPVITNITVVDNRNNGQRL